MKKLFGLFTQENKCMRYFRYFTKKNCRRYICSIDILHSTQALMPLWSILLKNQDQHSDSWAPLKYAYDQKCVWCSWKGQKYFSIKYFWIRFYGQGWTLLSYLPCRWHYCHVDSYCILLLGFRFSPLLTSAGHKSRPSWNKEKA